jgi:ABC-2 type transport system permease protein
LKDSSPVFEIIIAATPYGGNYAFLTLSSGIGDILGAISASLLFIIVMIAITYFAFRKAEIK